MESLKLLSNIYEVIISKLFYTFTESCDFSWKVQKYLKNLLKSTHIFATFQVKIFASMLLLNNKSSAFWSLDMDNNTTTKNAAIQENTWVIFNVSMHTYKQQNVTQKGS